MKPSVVMFFSCVLGLTSLAAAEPAPKLPVQRSQALPKPIKPIDPPRLVRQCPDLAASVQFRLIRTNDAFSGRVEITAKVENLGSEYVSRPNQQQLSFYENVPGGAPRLIATVPFQNLATNAIQTVSFTRDWNRSSPAEGEFPPAYRAVISYDPDIRLDSNPKNDDCRSSNDQAERSGSEINTLLTPAG